MKKYNIDLSVNDFIKLEKIIDDIDNKLFSDDFMKYVANKCMELLKKIAISKLSTVNTQEDIDASKYMNSMNMKIEKNTIYLYNNATIDTSTRKISDDKRANYPLQLSLAKIVEFGIGYTGSIRNNGRTNDEDWQYDVNEHGYKGWYYENNGQTFWTNGFEGRFVFLTLVNEIQNNISKWINEYLEK